MNAEQKQRVRDFWESNMKPQLAVDIDFEKS